MKIPNYCDHKAFQRVFEQLPEADREEVKRGVKRFLESDAVVVMDEGNEELASVSTLSSCQIDEFVSPDIPWEMTSFGSTETFIHELEWALAQVHREFGHDPYGSPRPVYTQWEEFREILRKTPQRFKEQVFETFGSNEASSSELTLRDLDGYVSPLTFVAWALGALGADGDELQDLIEELGEAINAINTKVANARSEAYQKGQIPFEDGKRPTPVGWQ